MTTNKVHDATCYAFQPGEPVFVDANVWIYIQPPVARTQASVAAGHGSAGDGWSTDRLPVSGGREAGDGFPDVQDVGC